MRRSREVVERGNRRPDLEMVMRPARGISFCECRELSQKNAASEGRPLKRHFKKPKQSGASFATRLKTAALQRLCPINSRAFQGAVASSLFLVSAGYSFPVRPRRVLLVFA